MQTRAPIRTRWWAGAVLGLVAVAAAPPPAGAADRHTVEIGDGLERLRVRACFDAPVY